MQGKMMEN